MGVKMAVLTGPNANLNHNPNHNPIPKILTLNLSLSLTLTIYPARYGPQIMVGGGRLWSGVVGGDFSQTGVNIGPVGHSERK